MEQAEVNTKYKTVDKKIKLVAVPLLEDSWQKMKEVANDPSLKDPKTIGNVFTEETKGKLRVGREDFLLLEECYRVKEHGAGPEVIIWPRPERRGRGCPWSGNLLRTRSICRNTIPVALRGTFRAIVRPCYPGSVSCAPWSLLMFRCLFGTLSLLRSDAGAPEPP